MARFHGAVHWLAQDEQSKGAQLKTGGKVALIAVGAVVVIGGFVVGKAENSPSALGMGSSTAAGTTLPPATTTTVPAATTTTLPPATTTSLPTTTTTTQPEVIRLTATSSNNCLSDVSIIDDQGSTSSGTYGECLMGSRWTQTLPTSESTVEFSVDGLYGIVTCEIQAPGQAPIAQTANSPSGDASVQCDYSAAH